VAFTYKHLAVAPVQQRKNCLKTNIGLT